MDGVRPSMLPIVRRASFIGGYMTEGHRRPTELPRLAGSPMWNTLPVFPK